MPPGRAKVFEGFARAQPAIPPQQRRGDGQVHHIEGDGVDVGPGVRAGCIVDGARHPSAERHAADGEQKSRADAPTCLTRGEERAHDYRVRRDDTALHEAEGDASCVEHSQAVGGEKHDQHERLQERPNQQGAQTADTIREPARHHAAHDPEAEHERQHLSSARGRIAEIEHVGHDMHLGHGHSDATSHPGHADQALQQIRRHRERSMLQWLDRSIPAIRGLGLGPAGQQRAQRQHRAKREHGEPHISRTPAVDVHEVLKNGRPHRTRHVAPTDGDADCESAPDRKPVGYVGDQGREYERCAQKSAQHAEGETELGHRRGKTRRVETRRQAQAANNSRHDDAESVRQASHDDATDAKTDHEERVGKRGGAAAGFELLCHGREDDDRGVHRRAADGHQRQGGYQAYHWVGAHYRESHPESRCRLRGELLGGFSHPCLGWRA